MKALQSDSKLSCEEKYVLRTLLYFDLFGYPLSPEEILYFSPGTFLNTDTLHQCLFQLRRRGLLHYFHPFYQLHDNPERVSQRLQGNALARSRMPVARMVSRFLSQVPYVRAVMLSGSLSKGSMRPDSDIDFFIITQPGRLWFVRGLIALFKRIFLFNSHRFLCANYFIDARTLEIEDRNVFTATEIITLIPTYGEGYFKRFIGSNRWASHLFPNAQFPRHAQWVSETDTWLKKTMERACRGRFFDFLDRTIMHRAIRRWIRQYGMQYEPRSFELAFRSRPGISKSHPSNFQHKVLDTFASHLHSFEQQHQLNLSL